MTAAGSAARGLYVTGTDTGAGKTLASCVLVHALRRSSRAVGAMKPVASGSRATADGWRNEDGEALLASTGRDLPYHWVNPYALAQPTAPEIAAQQQQIRIDIAVLDDAWAQLQRCCDAVVVEGVGGWEAPLAADLMQADLCRRWHLPVVLVVGLRLGCINHARLTLRAIAADGLDCIGWIGNRVDAALLYAEETLALLRTQLPVPCLGVLPHLPHASPAQLVGCLHLPAPWSAD